MTGRKVDPYLFPKIPQQFASDPELRLWWNYTSKFLHDLWLRTGGGSDSVSDQSLQELYPWQDTEEEEGFDLTSFFDDKDPRHVITTSVDITVTGGDVIICTNTADITVTLNPNPDENEIVSVIRAGTGLVTVSGGARNINDQLTYRQIMRYESNDFPYSVENDQWYIL